MIEIDKSELKEVVKTGNWFSKVGEDYHENIEGVTCVSRSRFDGTCEPFSENWDYFVMEWRNVFSSFLSSNHREEHRKWNKLLKIIKSQTSKVLAPLALNFAKEQGHSEQVATKIITDIDICLMRTVYESLDPPKHFKILLDLYLAGRCPCDAEEREGSLYVVCY